jgi:hypothetical protein
MEQSTQLTCRKKWNEKKGSKTVITDSNYSPYSVTVSTSACMAIHLILLQGLAASIARKKHHGESKAVGSILALATS